MLESQGEKTPTQNRPISLFSFVRLVRLHCENGGGETDQITIAATNAQRYDAQRQVAAPVQFHRLHVQLDWIAVRFRWRHPPVGVCVGRAVCHLLCADAILIGLQYLHWPTCQWSQCLLHNRNNCVGKLNQQRIDFSIFFPLKRPNMKRNSTFFTE